MKLQGLAIIFILIILPITLIIGEYANAQKETIALEQKYDSSLINATHDALKAFQINTFNDAASDIADSKISSIEASVNAFYNSMESSFGMQGYSQADLQSYVPAIVYTMYDGYYIYSPYTNVADLSSGTGLNIDLNSNNIQYGFKPYVYYSCRYTMGSNSDFVINYSLDNHITVQGTVNGEPVKGTGIYSGYLLTIANSIDDEGIYYDRINNKYYYSGIEIKAESNLTEYLIDGEYKYIKLNGTKYYWDEHEENIFYILGRNRIKQVEKSANEEVYNSYVEKIKNNTSAISYYKQAYEFSTWVQENLKDLKVSNAKANMLDTGNGNIFQNKKIEYPSSNFNLHRKEVIRYSIESNLSVAIANFNNYTNSTNFQMPKLDEIEWEMLQNEVSIISFLQGLNIGGKVYNGYTVVTNSKTEEIVKEERIYITTTDGYYHKTNDEDLIKEYAQDELVLGVFDLDFEIRKDASTGTYYTHKTELGCYGSIIGQEKVDNSFGSMYEYLRNLEDIEQAKKIKQIYYISIGRERFGMYKVENPSNITSIIDKME